MRRGCLTCRAPGITPHPADMTAASARLREEPTPHCARVPNKARPPALFAGRLLLTPGHGPTSHSAGCQGLHPSLSCAVLGKTPGWAKADWLPELCPTAACMPTRRLPLPRGRRRPALHHAHPAALSLSCPASSYPCRRRPARPEADRWQGAGILPEGPAGPALRRRGRPQVRACGRETARAPHIWCFFIHSTTNRYKVFVRSAGMAQPPPPVKAAPLLGGRQLA